MPTLPPGVIISDPQNLDFVFKNEGLFNKGRFVKERSWDLFGKSYDVPLENRRGNLLCEDLSLSLSLDPQVRTEYPILCTTLMS